MEDTLKHGEVLFANGKIEEAEKCFANILELDPRNKEALNNLGVIAFQSQKIENAIDYFDKSLKLDPFYKEAVLNYTHILKELELLNEASPFLYKIMEKYPKDKELKQLLNEIEMAQEPKRKIAVLCLPGIESFLGDIVDFLQTKYEVRTCYSNNNRDIEAAAHWADIVWLEWANQMAVHVTNKVPQIKDKKVICRLHGYEVFTDLPAQINWSVVDQLIFVAKHKQQIFNQKFKIQFQPQTILRNGVNTNKFTIAENKQNTKRLVLLGHINFRKGLPLLLQFYHELLKHDPEYYLYIRGDFQDHRLEVAALTMINELSLSNKLEFVDWVEDLNAWLADKSHILSFSLEESFHYAIGNGMAAGMKPVIHAWNESRDIWPQEFIFNDLNGFLHLMKDEKYDPQNYRKLLFENQLTLITQTERIREIIEELSNNISPSTDQKSSMPVQKDCLNAIVHWWNGLYGYGQ